MEFDGKIPTKGKHLCKQASQITFFSYNLGKWEGLAEEQKQLKEEREKTKQQQD
jgi:hypothetical protein